MKRYATLEKVLEDYDNLEWFGTLFTNKEQWKRRAREAEFLYLAGDDELEDIADPDTLQPRLAQEADMAYFLDVQVFQDVIKTQREQKENSSIDDYIAALNHYREYDAFLVLP